MKSRLLGVLPACALALLPHSVQAVDVVTGNELTNVVVVDGEFTPDVSGSGVPQVGVENFNDYWNSGGSSVQVSASDIRVDADITLGANDGRRLDLTVNGNYGLVELHSSITGSVISGEGGALKVGSDFFDTTDDITIVELGANSATVIGGGIPDGHLSEIDSINVNANGMAVRENASITLGENDSFKLNRTWFDLGGAGLVTVPDRTLLVNDGLIEQRGANTRVDIDGFFNQEGVYVLQGQGSRLDVTYDVDMVGGSTTTFDQYSGTTNTIGEDLLIDRGAIYNMHGGQLTADSISGIYARYETYSGGNLISVDIELPGHVNNSNAGQFNYTDGGVKALGSDFYIRDGGLLGQDLVIDTGESFGARNMYIGTLNDGLTDFGGQGVGALASGSIIMNGGSNRVVENMVIGQQAMMTQNSGFNSIGGDLDLDGGAYTQNDGSNTVDGTISMSSGGVYTLNNGNLTAGNISGSFNYVNGGVRLTKGSIDIRSNGLLGQDLLIDENETFGAVNMTVGTLNADSGSINQSTGRNLIQGELRIEAGGSYDMSGGRLEFGTFAGPGTINFIAGGIYAGSDISVGASGPVGSSLLLDTNKTLSLQAEGDFRNPRNDLTIDAGADLVLDGGTLIANRINKIGDFNYASGHLDLNFITFGDTGQLGNFTVTNDHNLFARNDVTIEAGTTVTVESGSISGGATINNSGNLVLNGGSLNSSQINNTGAGNFDFASGNLSLDSLNVADTGLLGKTVELDSSKTINVSNVNVEAGSRLEINGGNSSATTLINEGDVVVSQAGQLTGGTYSQSGVTATTTIDGLLNADVEILSGTLNGSGTINGNTINGGEFAPGNSPGALHVIGDFTQTEFGTLHIEIGGLLPGDEYDVFNIDGIADLGGTLDVDLYDFGSGQFAPSLGDAFDFLTAESIIGDFDLFTLAVLGDGLGWQLDFLYDEIGTTDIARLSVVEISSLPVPAAVWLFSSGLIGLVGVARRNKAA